MTAETDIAALDDGGANTVAEVRTALTSILARADLAPTWTDYSPTWTNFTLGNGTDDSRFIQLGTGAGSLVIVQIEVELGSTSSVSGVPIFSLPATSRAYTLGAGETRLGEATFIDVGAAFFDGLVTWQSTTTAAIRSKDVSGSFVKAGAVGSTSPFTWTSGDSFSATLVYEAG